MNTTPGITSRHLSQRDQARRYFGARHHVGMPSAPIAHRAAWRGAELASNALAEKDPSFYRLTPADLTEIERSLAILHDRQRTNPRTTIQLRADDLPLLGMANRIARWHRELASGRGFVLIRGLPVASWSAKTTEQFFWCFGQHLGIPGLQNPQGDLLGHVTDTGDSKLDPLVRLYRTNASIRYHCDGADVVGLLCTRNSTTGGTSRIASSVTLYNELLQQTPYLAKRLHAPMKLDRRNEQRPGQLPYSEVQPACYDGTQLKTFYHGDYYRSVTRHVGALSVLETELLDTYEQIASQAGIFFEMNFEPGDIQLLSNHTVVHARTAYEDQPGEPGVLVSSNAAATTQAAGRHLLRLWLSLEDP